MTAEPSVGTTVVSWYRSSLSGDLGPARMACARLRRCESPVDVLAVQETHDLNRRLRTEGTQPTIDQLALLATTFARLDGVDGKKLAAIFGFRESRDGPRKLSELRFQSLIRVRSRLDLLVPLRRSLAVLGNDLFCNGWQLANDLYFWNDRTRKTWCFQYFGAELAEGNNKE